MGHLISYIIFNITGELSNTNSSLIEATIQHIIKYNISNGWTLYIKYNRRN